MTSTAPNRGGVAKAKPASDAAARVAACTSRAGRISRDAGRVAAARRSAIPRSIPAHRCSPRSAARSRPGHLRRKRFADARARSAPSNDDLAAAGLERRPRDRTGDGFQQLARIAAAAAATRPRADRPALRKSRTRKPSSPPALIAASNASRPVSIAVWYPIKKRHDCDLWLARILRGVERPTLATSGGSRPADCAVGPQRIGYAHRQSPMAVRFRPRADWQAELHELLARHGRQRSPLAPSMSDA